jgi:hypothetical protein
MDTAEARPRRTRLRANRGSSEQWVQGGAVVWVYANSGFAVRHWQAKAHLKRMLFATCGVTRPADLGGESANQLRPKHIR